MNCLFLWKDHSSQLTVKSLPNGCFVNHDCQTVSLFELGWLSIVVPWLGSLTKTREGRKDFCFWFSSKPQKSKGTGYFMSSVFLLMVLESSLRSDLFTQDFPFAHSRWYGMTEGKAKNNAFMILVKIKYENGTVYTVVIWYRTLGLVRLEEL